MGVKSRAKELALEDARAELLADLRRRTVPVEHDRRRLARDALTDLYDGRRTWFVKDLLASATSPGWLPTDRQAGVIFSWIATRATEPTQHLVSLADPRTQPLVRAAKG